LFFPVPYRIFIHLHDIIHAGTDAIRSNSLAACLCYSHADTDIARREFGNALHISLPSLADFYRFQFTERGRARHYTGRAFTTPRPVTSRTTMALLPRRPLRIIRMGRSGAKF
jgi:hypothetical protein